jgi:hypothetical protein
VNSFRRRNYRHGNNSYSNYWNTDVRHVGNVFLC